MVESSGWQRHLVATEERFTRRNFCFLILTRIDRKVSKIKAFLDIDELILTGIYTTKSCS